jgi:hypothetical protein
MDEKTAYLLGLMCGRGHIYTPEKRIVIEFAHKNSTVNGIAQCKKCGDLASLKKKDNPGGYLICKSCGSKVDKSVKHEYEQRVSTGKSINEFIMPFLKSEVGTDFCIIGNEHMTLLIIDMISKPKKFDEIAGYFEGKLGFDSFGIPKKLYDASRDCKVEFINGFMDTAGFFNAGGWLPRKGKNGTARMRAYFQIVRNWRMPVLICNFIKTEMKLPIHTIDWGHPNIRDSGLEDYFNSGTVSWSREHQVKFFPEYYAVFNPRLKHKNEMLKELIRYNTWAGFDSAENCSPPGGVNYKPYHPGETDLRIPERIRKHYDAYWQICTDLNCIFSNICLKKAKNPDIYYLTGKDGDGSIAVEKVIKDIEAERQELTKKAMENGTKVKKIKTAAPVKQITDLEFTLYEPISKWLSVQAPKEFSQEVTVHITSAQNLDKFVSQNSLAQFAYCEEYKIRPDIVAFLQKDNKLVFVEVKIGDLTLKDIGQLMGYCLVAKPEKAYLVSPKPPSMSLVRVLEANPDLLSYDKKKLTIGTWEHGSITELVF